MRVSLSFATTNVITRKNARGDIRLRSTDPISVDGVAVEPNDKGKSDLDLTTAQSEAFRAMLAEGLDPETAASGIITLPDGGSRGAPEATGPSLASFVKTEAPATGKAK